MCKELRLVIEIDGITHDSNLDKDWRRTDELRRAGFHVIRFTRAAVLTNIQGVASEIRKIVKDIEPPPAPPPAGDNENA
jgi:very-short-patch-repair endonuclease